MSTTIIMIAILMNFVVGILVGVIAAWKYSIPKTIEWMCDNGYVHYEIRNGTYYMTKLEDA